MESLAAIEPNAAALGQAAPQRGASWQRGQPDEMLDGGLPAASLALESAPPSPWEGRQGHVQTAALETPNRPRDAVVSSGAVSENVGGSEQERGGRGGDKVGARPTQSRMEDGRMQGLSPG